MSHKQKIKSFFARLQYLLPQHWLSIQIGKIAHSRSISLKNFLIKKFIHHYSVTMSDALIEDINQYPSFNDFFIRQLKPESRPLCTESHSIICPVDGIVQEIGILKQTQLVQAKNSFFDLNSLLPHEDFSKNFVDGSFAIFYLAPNNYHRVHMPITGELIKTLYVPGKLFSVNQITSDIIPNLYCRNERVCGLFNTEVGPMAVIMVGAFIVGSIQTVWEKEAIRGKKIEIKNSDKKLMKRGEELGYFNMGSTVIVLFAKDHIQWAPHIRPHLSVQFGQFLGRSFELICS